MFKAERKRFTVPGLGPNLTSARPTFYVTAQRQLQRGHQVHTAPIVKTINISCRLSSWKKV